MTFSLRALGIFAIVAAALAAASCSSHSGAAEDGYASEMAEALAPTLAALDDLIAESEATYQVRERQRAIAANDRLLPAVGEAVQRLDAIAPSDANQADHRAIVAALGVISDRLRERRVAFASDELGKAKIAEMRIQLALSETAIDTDPVVCNVLVEGRAAVCEPPPGSGEGFERALWDLTRRFAASVGPRIGGLPLLSNDDETIEYLDEIQPEVEQGLAELSAEAAALEPPDELKDDHAAVTAYFSGLLSVAKRITAAAHQGDIQQIRRLFSESGAVARRLGRALSARGTELILAPLAGPSGMRGR